jgi:hypothetical protein
MSEKCDFDGCEKLAEPGEIYSPKRLKAMLVCHDHWKIVADEGWGGYLVSCPCCGVQFEAG